MQKIMIFNIFSVIINIGFIYINASYFHKIKTENKKLNDILKSDLKTREEARKILEKIQDRNENSNNLTFNDFRIIQ